MTAAPRMVIAARVSMSLSSWRVAAVIPTLVAVRIAPMKTADAGPSPKRSATALPATNGTRTPPQAARKAPRPTDRIAAALVSSPATPRMARGAELGDAVDRSVDDERSSERTGRG